MILLISGPSGAGKSTVYQELMRREPRLRFSVSTTTRPPRAGETEGVDYHFVDEPAFDRLVAADAFLEWAHVHDRRYGTRRDHVRQLEAAGHIPLLDIDVQGGQQVLAQLGGDVVSVFVWPPSWQALEERLRGRGTDTDEVIATRLQNARWEVGFADRYTYWVINDDVAAAVARLQAILLAEACRRERLPGPPVRAAE
ncbi:MAG: guanylate kinase [Candidatus Krumholzibacteria bacterium]|nr:guanylate kinase [Candidatus Krumholzibacteria bacterium]